MRYLFNNSQWDFEIFIGLILCKLDKLDKLDPSNHQGDSTRITVSWLWVWHTVHDVLQT